MVPGTEGRLHSLLVAFCRVFGSGPYQLPLDSTVGTSTLFFVDVMVGIRILHIDCQMANRIPLRTTTVVVVVLGILIQ